MENKHMEQIVLIGNPSQKGLSSSLVLKNELDKLDRRVAEPTTPRRKNGRVRIHVIKQGIQGINYNNNYLTSLPTTPRVIPVTEPITPRRKNGRQVYVNNVQNQPIEDTKQQLFQTQPSEFKTKRIIFDVNKIEQFKKEEFRQIDENTKKMKNEIEKYYSKKNKLNNQRPVLPLHPRKIAPILKASEYLNKNKSWQVEKIIEDEDNYALQEDRRKTEHNKLINERNMKIKLRQLEEENKKKQKQEVLVKIHKKYFNQRSIVQKEINKLQKQVEGLKVKINIIEIELAKHQQEYLEDTNTFTNNWKRIEYNLVINKEKEEKRKKETEKEQEKEKCIQDHVNKVNTTRENEEKERNYKKLKQDPEHKPSTTASLAYSSCSNPHVSPATIVKYNTTEQKEKQESNSIFRQHEYNKNQQQKEKLKIVEIRKLMKKFNNHNSLVQLLNKDLKLYTDQLIKLNEELDKKEKQLEQLNIYGEIKTKKHFNNVLLKRKIKCLDNIESECDSTFLTNTNRYRV